MGCSACRRAREKAKSAAQNLASGKVKDAAKDAKDFANNVGKGLKQNYFKPKKK